MVSVLLFCNHKFFLFLLTALTSPSLLFPNLKLLLTNIYFASSFLDKISLIKNSDLILEKFLSNFFVIIKSTPKSI